MWRWVSTGRHGRAFALLGMIIFIVGSYLIMIWNLRCNGASFSGRLGSELRMLEERLKRGEMAPPNTRSDAGFWRVIRYSIDRFSARLNSQIDTLSLIAVGVVSAEHNWLAPINGCNGG